MEFWKTNEKMVSGKKILMETEQAIGPNA